MEGMGAFPYGCVLFVWTPVLEGCKLYKGANHFGDSLFETSPRFVSKGPSQPSKKAAQQKSTGLYVQSEVILAGVYNDYTAHAKNFLVEGAAQLTSTRLIGV